MADLGEDSPPPAQDIKLVLGWQEEGPQEVTVNRAALAGLSPVFESMLTHSMMEKIHGTVRLEAVSPKAWTVISAFYFLWEIHVTRDNVEEMVCLADLYELTDLKNYCDYFLCKIADEFEEISVLLHWATTFRLENLKNNILKLVREDFEYFGRSDSFLGLSKEVLLEILSGPYIVASESFVCFAVLRWLLGQNADSSTAKQMLHQLKLTEVCLSCLKKLVNESQYAAKGDLICSLIDMEKKKKEKESPVQMSMELICQDFDRLKWITLPNKTSGCCGPTCSGEPAEDGRTFFLHTGVYDNIGVLLDGTEIPFGRWMCPSAVCFFEKFLVVKADDHFSCVAFYDLEAKRWISSPSLLQGRVNNGMVVIGDALYAVMGDGGHTNLDSIEVFRSDTGEWRPAGRMQRATTHVTAAAVGNLIIAAGSSDEGRLYQSFNTETGASAILHQDRSDPRQFACSLGPRTADFVNSGIICMSLQESGEVAITEQRRPNPFAVFDWVEFSPPDILYPAPEEEGSPRQLQQLVERYNDTTSYFVRFSLGKGRMNLTPVPVHINGSLMFVTRP